MTISQAQTKAKKEANARFLKAAWNIYYFDLYCDEHEECLDIGPLIDELREAGDEVRLVGSTPANHAKDTRA